MPREKTSLPKYRGTYPPYLATHAQLAAEGLRRGRPEPVALLEYEQGDVSGTCGLHERAAALPLNETSPTPPSPSLP